MELLRNLQKLQCFTHKRPLYELEKSLWQKFCTTKVLTLKEVDNKRAVHKRRHQSGGARAGTLLKDNFSNKTYLVNVMMKGGGSKISIMMSSFMNAPKVQLSAMMKQNPIFDTKYSNWVESFASVKF